MTSSTSPTQLRVARAGDLCLLLLAQEPPDRSLLDALSALRARLGGRIVSPLHLTIDRYDGPTTSRSSLFAAIDALAAQVAPLPLRSGQLLPFRSEFRGRWVLKARMHETSDAGLALLRSAGRAAGAVSLYGEQKWWTVTLLEEILPSTDPQSDLVLPDPLFVADRLQISMIHGVGRYEILHTSDLHNPRKAPSGGSFSCFDTGL